MVVFIKGIAKTYKIIAQTGKDSTELANIKPIATSVYPLMRQVTKGNTPEGIQLLLRHLDRLLINDPGN